MIAEYTGLQELAPGSGMWVKTWKFGPCKVFTAIDDGLWHLSISHPKRYPTWDEIHYARYELIPNEITMAMILPPKEEYVNVHSNCFHLHEIKGENDRRIITV